jgi:membrane associated rhomboid family serine protease
VIIPYQVDVPMQRWPLANFIILAAIALALAAESAASPYDIRPWILDGWSVQGLLGYFWLHAGIVHAAGNGLFLWTFGNAVCAKIGNLTYLLLYLVLGVLAGVVHLVFDGGRAVGASGAINGVIGMYLVLYPLNSVTCAYALFVRFGRFSLSGYWLILLWLAFDIWGAVSGAGSIAYWAHLGGFAAGFAVTWAAVWTKAIRMDPDERSLLQVFGFGRNSQRPRPAIAGATTAYGEQARATRQMVAHVAGADPDAEYVHLRCSCGKALKAPRRLLGRAVACPQCSQPIRVQERGRGDT